MLNFVLNSAISFSKWQSLCVLSFLAEICIDLFSYKVGNQLEEAVKKFNMNKVS